MQLLLSFNQNFSAVCITHYYSVTVYTQLQSTVYSFNEIINVLYSTKQQQYTKLRTGNFSNLLSWKVTYKEPLYVISKVKYRHK